MLVQNYRSVRDCLPEKQHVFSQKYNCDCGEITFGDFGSYDTHINNHLLSRKKKKASQKGTPTYYFCKPVCCNEMRLACIELQ